MEENKAEKTGGGSTHQKKNRCVYSAAVARKLIRGGFPIADIKPNKYNRNKTVFIFEASEIFNTALGSVLAECERRANENKEIDRQYEERLETLFTSHDLKPNFDVFEMGHPLYDPAREWTIDWDCD